MNRLLISTALLALLALPMTARAADMIPDVPQETAAATTWTGIYFGGALGYGWGNGDYHVQEAPDFKVGHDIQGLVAGGQVGGIYQAGMLAGGLEVQGLWSQLGGDENFTDYALSTQTDVSWLIMAKAKAGVAYDRFFVFGTGGYAGAKIGPSAKYSPACDNACGSAWSDDQFANGFFYGAGANVKLTDNVVVGVEWNHIVLDDVKFGGTAKGGQFDGAELHATGNFVFDQVLATASFMF